MDAQTFCEQMIKKVACFWFFKIINNLCWINTVLAYNWMTCFVKSQFRYISIFIDMQGPVCVYSDDV